ncbi:MAG: diguanylate cyclase [Verrucomicrobiae bacterium]|nr:diguanylate cyclase [Verrucomicrobiae bacterium]
MPDDYLSFIKKLAANPVAPEQLARLSKLALMQKDPLTGLLDYRSFSLWLQEALGRSPLSLIALGLDHLNEINLLGTWVIGDVAICSLGSMLEKSLGEDENAGRLTGGTFIVARCETDPAKIRLWINDMAEKIGALVLPSVEMLPDGKLTLSAGFFCTQDHEKETAEQLMLMANKRLDFAKQQGGNTITMMAADSVTRREDQLVAYGVHCRKIGASRWDEARLTELSPNGIAMATNHPLLVREHVELSILKDQKTLFNSNGNVVWRRASNNNENAQFLIGIRFEGLDKKQAESIQSLIEGVSHE